MSTPETTIRPYHPQDNEAIHQVVLRSAEHDQVDPHSTLESVPTLEEFITSLETNRTDPSADVFVAVDDATKDIVGYGKVGWWEEEDGTFLYLHQGVIDPAHRGKGTGSQLVSQLQDRIRAIAAAHPADAPKMFGANASDTEADTLRLLDHHDYQQAFSSLEMEFVDPSKIEDLRMPEGFELRPVVADEEKRKVYDVNNRVYEGAPGAGATTEEGYKNFLGYNPDTSLWKVAWDGDNVAGFVLSNTKTIKGDEGDQKIRAEISQVAVAPEYRRRGLGQALMAENIRDLQKRDFDILRLHTDADGKMGGRQLYESLGFKALKESRRFRKPL
jgi:mycothiol synthase